jgi:Fic family protein
MVTLGESPRDGATVPVTPLGYRDDVWIVDDDGASKAQRERESGPYRSPVVTPIVDIGLSLPGDLAADVDEATQALTRFDAYATSLLGEGELAPMAAILLRTESTSSSNIEQITAGAKQIALAELGESGSENANLVVSNVHAMEAAIQLADDIGEDNLLHMHAQLLTEQPSLAGRYREGLVWVGGSKYGPRGATHVGPPAVGVPAAMRDLYTFVKRNDLPPLVLAAIAHAQLETIHPFADGNGRIGRALVHAILRRTGTVQRATAPVSAGLLRDTDRYFGALTSFRAGDARPIIERFSEASRFAAVRGSQLVDDLHAQTREARELLRAVRSDAAAHRVIPLLVGQPVINVTFIQKHLDLDARSAFRAIETLVREGVLVERTGRSRNRVFQHNGMIQVLDDFAADIRRD